MGSGWRCSTCSSRWRRHGLSSSPSTTCSGSTRPRPECSSSHFGGYGRSGSACWPRTGLGRRRQCPSSSSARSPRSGSTSSRSARSASAAFTGSSRSASGSSSRDPSWPGCSEATAGNPFFALELGRELVRTGARPAPGQALHVPDSLRDLLGGRLARLPGETLDVLLLVSALARPTVDVVATAHGERTRVEQALDSAGAEGVVEFDGARIRFSHPLLASICYEQASPWKRRAAHRALADAVTDVEEQTRHLALAADRPDAEIASRLDDAAEQAAGRGAPAAAADLCELAAELTPGDPAPARQRRLRAANYHFLAGDRKQSADLLDRLLTEVQPGVERADVLFALASTFRADAHASIAICDEALAEASGDDARCARILGFRTWSHLLAANLGAAVDDSRAALALAERVGDPALVAAVIARVAQAESWAADFTPGLLERGVEIEDRLGLVLDYRASPRVYLPRLLMRRGEIERPRALLEELERNAAARGDEGTRALTLWYLATLEWLAGRWQVALDHMDEAEELAAQIMFAWASGWTGRVRALVEADLGLVEAARESADDRTDRRSQFFERDLHVPHPGRARPARARAREPGGRGRLPARPARTAARARRERPDAAGLGRCDRDADRPRRARAGARRTSSRTSGTGGSWGARGRWPPPRAAAACSPPPRETRPPRSRRSTARSPSSTPIRTRSSADARCSASAPCAGRRSRRRRPGRRSSRLLRSSRSSGTPLGREGPRRAGADQRPRAAPPRS